MSVNECIEIIKKLNYLYHAFPGSETTEDHTEHCGIFTFQVINWLNFDLEWKIVHQNIP